VVDRRSVGDATRLRASAVLASSVAFGLGAALPRSGPGRGVVRGLAVATAVGGVALAWAGRPWPVTDAARVSDDDTVELDWIHVLIAARDEAGVIGGVISDLAHQEPPTGFSVSVVDDRSTDDTAAVARGAIDAGGLGDRATVTRRSCGADGKSAALGSVRGIAATSRAAILVLDADARLDADFIRRCRSGVSGARAISARRHVLRPRSRSRWARFLADAQAAEQAADDLVQRGRARLGGAGELRGNGMAMRADVLADLGGWPVPSLAEDLALSTRLYLRKGRGATRPAGFEIWEQAPTRLPTMVRQRLRWAEGSVRRDLEIVAPALADRDIPFRRRAEVPISSGQDLMPWLALGVLVGSRSDRRTVAAELPVGYAVAAVAIALAAAERCTSPGRRIAGLLALGLSWALVLPFAWLRVSLSAAVRFRPTPHLAAADLEPPPFAVAAGERRGPRRRLTSGARRP